MPVDISIEAGPNNSEDVFTFSSQFIATKIYLFVFFFFTHKTNINDKLKIKKRKI